MFRDLVVETWDISHDDRIEEKHIMIIIKSSNREHFHKINKKQIARTEWHLGLRTEGRGVLSLSSRTVSGAWINLS